MGSLLLAIEMQYLSNVTILEESNNIQKPTYILMTKVAETSS